MACMQTKVPMLTVPLAIPTLERLRLIILKSA